MQQVLTVNWRGLGGNRQVKYLRIDCAKYLINNVGMCDGNWFSYCY